MTRHALHLLTLTLLLLAALADTAAAGSAPPVTAGRGGNSAQQQDLMKGKLPGDKKPTAPIEPTVGQLTEANVIYEQCVASEMQSQYYDCKCLSLAFLQLRVESQQEKNYAVGQYGLIEEARKACVNKSGIAGKTYSECKSWAASMMTDTESFCSCYGSNYAKIYASNPTSNIKINERMQRASLIQCGAASESQKRVEQEKAMLKMQQEGTYEKLFPAAEGELPSKQAPKPSGPAMPKTLGQTLSGQLHSGETGQ